MKKKTKKNALDYNQLSYYLILEYFYRECFCVRLPTTIYRHFITCVVFTFLLVTTIGVVQAQAKGELRLGITLEPPVLDPTINASTSIQKITYQNIFEGLTQIDESNQVQPSLAKEWRVDKSGLIYTFTIRKGVFFHDQSELTATIVKASLEKIIADKSRNPIKNKFLNIEDINVINTHVIRIKLKNTDGHFLYNLGLGSAIIAHPRSWDNNASHPVGTGPYRFVKWKEGDHIALIANHHYWGTLGTIQDIKIIFTQTRSQVVSYLADGLLDGYSSMTEVGFLDSLFSIRQDYVLKTGNTNGEIILAMNHANKMLASKEIRQAITKAINKKVIADTPNFMTGAEIGSHYSPDDYAYLDISKAYPFNVSDAKLLVAKSGIDIQPLVLMAPPPTYSQYISLHVQQMLEEIGIAVRIEKVSWQEWLVRVYKDKDYDLTVVAHTEPNDLDIYARDDYYFNYNNRDYRDIIAQLNATHEKKERAILLKKAQQKLSDDAVNVFLFMLPKVGIWHKELQGYWINDPIPSMIFSQMYWQK